MYNGLAFLNNDGGDTGEHLFQGVSSDQSNLADIFDADSRSSDSGSSLKYVPPKPAPTKPSNEKAAWSVVIAKIVTAFKLVDDSNVPQGQLGIALLTHSQIHSSKLILYKTKDQLLSTLVLKKTGKLYWKPPYLQYHDDLSVFWSLLFANVDDFTALSEHFSDQCEVIQTPCEQAVRTKSTDSQKPDECSNAHEDSERKSVEPDQKASNHIPSNDNADGTKSKSDILSRVVKVGHRMPLINRLENDVVDSVAPSEAMSQHLDKPKALDEMTLNPPKSTSLPNTLAVSSDFNAFTSECRLQNTELRINVSKLDSKLDRVIDGIEILRLSAHTTPASKESNELEEEIIKLEERILEMKKENRRLKLQLRESDMVRKQKLEHDKQENTMLETLRTECDAKQSRIDELSAQVDKVLESSRNELDGMKKENDEQIQRLQCDLDAKSGEIESLQQQMTEASAKSGEIVRAILNEFYQKLHETIGDKDDVSADDVLKLSADIIRKETKAALGFK